MSPLFSAAGDGGRWAAGLPSIVTRRTIKRPRLFFPLMCVKPRKSNVNYEPLLRMATIREVTSSVSALNLLSVRNSPNPARLRPHHRVSPLASVCLRKRRHVAHHAIDAPSPRRMRIVARHFPPFLLRDVH